MTRSYFRRADGVMLLYDVTNERSFLSVRQWIDAVDVSMNRGRGRRYKYFWTPNLGV